MPTEIEVLRAEIAELRLGLVGPRVPTDKEKKKIDKFMKENVTPLNSVAMLPDGKFHNREEILAKLGLDPNISPDAWLCVAGCGSNKAALRLDTRFGSQPR